jgi:dolichyl-phosphate-mannose-protein mannosyltransferase
MYNYASPAALFWDENYHIASAQKYLHQVHFMEPHPPLGKLMIALGEKILSPNEKTDQFLDTDYGREIPRGYSFAGYRLLPTLFAWLSAPLLFLIFFAILKNNIVSLLLSFLYIFDNALIVHQRSAMLESTLHFFMLCMILCWLYIIQEKPGSKRYIWHLIGCGASFGAVLTTKANGLILILLWPAVLFTLWPNWKQALKSSVYFGISTLVVFCGVWYTHFALATEVRSALPDKGYYKASPAYQTYLNEKTTKNIFHFPVMLADSLAFLPHYAAGVPSLNLCKPDENGSPWFYWPVGGRSINYRWETMGTAYKYLYLQSNPAVWFLGLIAVITSIGLLLSACFLPLKKQLKHPVLLLTFTGIYVSYMLTMARIDRVMYLYHYFIPLLCSFILLALVLDEIQIFWRWQLAAAHKTIMALCCSIAIFSSYQYYRPLSYYEPITDAAVNAKALLPVWDLRCARCAQDRYLHPNLCQ